jgi:endonuclease YncB( thermonuclease family)
MKEILTVLFIALVLLFSVGKTANVQDREYKVTRVIDGDTLEIQVDFLPQELGNTLKLRVLGVDTPEKKSTCESERNRALEATNFVKDLVDNAKKIEIQLKKWDKYGGRVLGEVIIDGKKLSEILIEKGYAVPYFGHKKEGWC